MMAKSERMMAVSTLETVLAKRFGGGMLHYDDLMAAIADVPTVEAEEVVYSPWDYDGLDAICKQCGFKWFDGCQECGVWPSKVNRCPNCGAKKENCKNE